jgi:hypothetical protein
VGVLLACVSVLGLGVWLAGRPSSAVAETGAADAVPVRIATVDALSVVERMMFSGPYKSQRDAAAAQHNDAINPMVARLREIEAAAKGLAPDAPELKALQEEYGTLNQKAQQQSNSGQQEIERLNLAQITECYRLVVGAADGLCEELGYSHLVSTRTGAPAFRSSDVQGVLDEMLARPMLRSPAADDITQRLIEKLKLQDVVVEVSPPAGAK